MTLPIPDDDAVMPPGPTDAGGRPDWLIDPSEGLGQIPPRTSQPLPAATVPRLDDVTPRHRAPEVAPRAEGLVGPEVPAAPPPAVLGDRNEQLGVDPASLAASALARSRGNASPARPALALSTSPMAVAPPAFRVAAASAATPNEHPKTHAAHDDPTPPTASRAWSAAASSIPSLRSSRRRAVPAEDLTPDAEWDKAQFTAPRAAPVESHATVRPPNPVVRRTSDPLAAVLRFAARVPTPVLALVAGVLVVAVITTAFLWPKEQFSSIRNIKAHARALDGQLVHVHGRVGQSFPVGGGFAFYLHQSRDTIVVFTRNRMPVERTHIKLVGTVSTGFLDGAPRAAIFEDPPPPN